MSNLLRAEGAAFFLAAIGVYATLQASWWLFLALILVPDLFMLGYLKDDRLGAVVYNIGHLYPVPILVGALALLFSWQTTLAIAVIWFAHIAMDRAFGFGLKRFGGFKRTHFDDL